MSTTDKSLTAALKVQIPHSRGSISVHEYLRLFLRNFWSEGRQWERDIVMERDLPLNALAQAGFIKSSVTTPEGDTGEEWPPEEFEAGKAYVSKLIDLIFAGGPTRTSEDIFPDSFPAICAQLRAGHVRGGTQTACFCICGNAHGGPAGTPACREFKRLIDAALGTQALQERYDQHLAVAVHSLLDATLLAREVLVRRAEHSATCPWTKGNDAECSSDCGLIAAIAALSKMMPEIEERG